MIVVMPCQDIMIFMVGFRLQMNNIAVQDKNFTRILLRKDFYVNAQIKVTWPVLSACSGAW